MRLSINIDAMHHEIDSTDPETLGRWIVEIFGRIQHPTPATLIQVSAMPTTIWNSEWDTPHGFKADWICDSRWLGQLGTVRTPRELLEQLTQWLDDYEARDVRN